jgi:hypothetical protein
MTGTENAEERIDSLAEFASADAKISDYFSRRHVRREKYFSPFRVYEHSECARNGAILLT